MLVAEAMTRDVRVANPGQTIQEAVAVMAEIDAGALPVVNRHKRLVGISQPGGQHTQLGGIR